MVTALWKERMARRGRTRALADEEVDAVLDAAWAAARRRHQAHPAPPVGGKPLVLYELVQSALEGRTLRNVDGLWHLDGNLQVTGRLGDLVEAQMDVDDSAVLSVLEVLACKEPLSQPVLEAITGHAAVVEAERRGLVLLERPASASAPGCRSRPTRG